MFLFINYNITFSLLQDVQAGLFAGGIGKPEDAKI